MNRPKIVVIASGKKDGLTGQGGGTGFENLVEASRDGRLDAEIVAVVCNHERGEIRERAERLGILFVHFDPSQHSNILENVGML